jgi:ATP-dependent 26S proteasome regulatory subunit
LSSKNEIEIETIIRARYPILYIVSWEERRVEDTLQMIAHDRGKTLYPWTLTQGFSKSTGQKEVGTRDPLFALDYILNAPDSSIFLLKDYHPFINDTSVTRRLRDLADALKKSHKTIVILSPVMHLPVELEKDVIVYDYDLPSYDDLDALLDNIILSLNDRKDLDLQLSPPERDAILKATLGLTIVEAENVFARSLVQTRSFDIDVILSEKEQIIRKSGLLEYYPAEEEIGNVGGLDLLKKWLGKRTSSFTKQAMDYGLPASRGILLLGVQGCGKSLTARTVGSLWKLPILRLDMGRIFAGLVGASEENMRRALKTAESVAPCILWLDELEKGLAGVQGSSSSDGGVTTRVFATFLTWLQEKKSPVFVVATANSVDSLPPELLRKGRFDEIFFIDLPSEKERKEIFSIHLQKRHRDPALFDLSALAIASPGFSGAEIEQSVIEAMYDAFGESRELTSEDILKACSNSVPLALTMREKIAQIREWSATRARAASSASPESEDEVLFLLQRNKNSSGAVSIYETEI